MHCLADAYIWQPLYIASLCHKIVMYGLFGVVSCFEHNAMRSVHGLCRLCTQVTSSFSRQIPSMIGACWWCCSQLKWTRRTGIGCVATLSHRRWIFSVYCRSANLTIRICKLCLMSWLLQQAGETLEQEACSQTLGTVWYTMFVLTAGPCKGNVCTRCLVGQESQRLLLKQQTCPKHALRMCTSSTCHWPMLASGSPCVLHPCAVHKCDHVDVYGLFWVNSYCEHNAVRCGHILRRLCIQATSDFSKQIPSVIGAC